MGSKKPPLLRYGFYVIPVQSIPRDTPPANTSKYRACGLRIFREKPETVPPLPQKAHRQQENEVSELGGMPFLQCTADTTKSFSELDGEAAPKGSRVCVFVAEKSLVRSGSEGSEAAPIPAKPLLIFRLTVEQADHLAFAGLCQVVALEESHESKELEVQEAILSLNESMRILAQGKPA